MRSLRSFRTVFPRKLPPVEFAQGFMEGDCPFAPRVFPPITKGLLRGRVALTGNTRLCLLQVGDWIFGFFCFDKLLPEDISDLHTVEPTGEEFCFALVVANGSWAF